MLRSQVCRLLGSAKMTCYVQAYLTLECVPSRSRSLMIKYTCFIWKKRQLFAVLTKEEKEKNLYQEGCRGNAVL